MNALARRLLVLCLVAGAAFPQGVTVGSPGRPAKRAKTSGPGGPVLVNEAVCPCFDLGGMRDLESTCASAIITGCASAYTFTEWCLDPFATIASYEALLGGNQCGFQLDDFGGMAYRPATPEEMEACHQAIITNPRYLSNCPR